MSRLRVPEQDQIIDKKDKGSGACRGFSHPVLRIFEAQKLLNVVEAHFQRPTSGKDFQNLGGSESEIEGEEAIVAAASAGVTHHDDAQELLAGAGIPQGIQALVTELDLLSIKRESGLDPFGFFVLRHLQGTGQAVAFLASTSPVGDIPRPFIA